MSDEVVIEYRVRDANGTVVALFHEPQTLRELADFMDERHPDLAPFVVQSGVALRTDGASVGRIDWSDLAPASDEQEGEHR
jgi:hypothetical protein